VASRPTVWSQIVSRYGNQQSTFSKLRQPKLFTITHVLSAVSNLGQTGKLLNCKNWSIEIHYQRRRNQEVLMSDALKHEILVVDDDPAIRDSLALVLQ